MLNFPSISQWVSGFYPSSQKKEPAVPLLPLVTEEGLKGPIETQERLNLLKETLLVFKEGGYRFADGHTVYLDSKVMQKSIEVFNQLKTENLPAVKTPFSTDIQVLEKDTFTAAIDLLNRYREPTCAINMANLYNPGGGYEVGCRAQEENCCYSSDMALGIDPKRNPYATHSYPLPLLGGIWSKNVTIIRKDQANGFALLRKPKKVDMIGFAAYDLREGSHDRKTLGLPLNGALSIKTLKSNAKFMQGTEQKIESFFVKAAEKGSLHIVGGAPGCGAFETPPELIAKICHKVLQKPKLQGRFRSVHFAILCKTQRDAHNFEVFKQVFKSGPVINLVVPHDKAAPAA